jgi:CDP-diacylglycerol--glycerol-3-phosphate 3-phosphatidyltransferase
VANELGDRAADLLVLAGCLALAPAPVVLLAMLAACLPSFVSLAGAAAGLPRLQAGPVGKVERVAVVAVVAAVGFATPLLLALAAGSVLTAARRTAVLRAQA